MKTTCIIIEDEPLAQTLLEQHLQQLKGYELLGKFENPIQALDIIQEKRIDVIFWAYYKPLRIIDLTLFLQRLIPNTLLMPLIITWLII
jgi:DNA-binding LytR/AlgR family response regulator